MSLFIFVNVCFQNVLSIHCNCRWDLANQCMPKWIETKRKTVEITVKILKWWCITVITVNTQTIGNSSNSLHHNTYMDPQPPLQATRGFENNFSMASLCMIFASLKTYAQKQSKKNIPTKWLQYKNLSVAHFNNEEKKDDPSHLLKLQFSKKKISNKPMRNI